MNAPIDTDREVCPECQEYVVRGRCECCTSQCVCNAPEGFCDCRHDPCMSCTLRLEVNL